MEILLLLLAVPVVIALKILRGIISVVLGTLAVGAYILIGSAYLISGAVNKHGS